MQCRNNLKQLAIGCLTHESVTKRLPSGGWGCCLDWRRRPGHRPTAARRLDFQCSALHRATAAARFRRGVAARLAGQIRRQPAAHLDAAGDSLLSHPPQRAGLSVGPGIAPAASRLSTPARPSRRAAAITPPTAATPARASTAAIRPRPPGPRPTPISTPDRRPGKTAASRPPVRLRRASSPTPGRRSTPWRPG